MSLQTTRSGHTLSNRYQLDRSVGLGGMSTVYKALDINLERIVAVKIIHQHLSRDETFVKRFQVEARTAAQLRHPNIVQVYDYNNEGSIYYIVLEYIPGETLQDRLRNINQAKSVLDLQEVTHIAVNVADALSYAHAKGLIHRDIKPANVMLNAQGDAILTDFGIVKIVGGTQHTATGAVMGTARYMSPEQIKGHKVGKGADIYSFGVMLYEMVGGRVPFESDSVVTTMMMHVNDPVPDLRRIRPGVPPALVAVINKALAKEPTQRFQSMAELAAALRQVETADTAQSSLPSSLPSHAAEETKRRSRVSKLTLALVAAGALGLLFVMTAIALVLGPGLFSADTPSTPVAEVTATGTTESLEVIPPPIASETPSPTATASLTPEPTTQPTVASTESASPTPLPPLIGREVIPLAQLTPQIPWLAFDADNPPATWYIGINRSKPPFDDLRVRQAFSMSVDRESIVENIIPQAGGPITVLTPPNVLGRDLYGEVGLSYDVESARHLLAEAGYPGGEGLPPIELSYFGSGEGITDQINQSIAEGWMAILGANVEVIAYPVWEDFLALLDTDPPQLFYLGWNAEYSDPDGFLRSADSYGYIDINNAEFDQLINLAARMPSEPAARQAIYVKAEQILVEQEAAIIPLYHR